MDSFLKNFGNRLAWGTLSLQAVIAAVQLAIQRHAPALWCAPANPGSKELLCGIGNASPWYLAYLGIMILLCGLLFIGSSWASFNGGVKRHGWIAYTLSAVVVFGSIIIVVALSGELNDQ